MATAGHVDHGKSTLIRALTGMEPDRWEEERRRGLTIDLGFAWTSLPSGRQVSFVDVPGHQRFLGNTLAGLGPAPVVCFVVAANEGWQVQSGDHRDAIAGLGIDRGVLVITKADRAPDRVDTVLAQARAELAGTGLASAPAVVVSAVAGTGLTDLRGALDDVLADLPAPPRHARVRLWVDRSFTITGAGTVVTGTLTAGTLSRGDTLELHNADRTGPVTVRGLQSRGETRSALEPVTRVALNLRGTSTTDVHRGDALVTPGAWPSTRELDIRRVSGEPLDGVPRHLVVHVGTAAVPGRLREFDADHARLTLDRALPLVRGDRLVLRNPGAQVIGGAVILDGDPPSLRRRGDGARRAVVLGTMDAGGDVMIELTRRGAVERQHLQRLGLIADDTAAPDGILVHGEWWVHDQTLATWRARLRTALQAHHERDPLAAGLSRGAARDLLALPDDSLLDIVIAGTGFERVGGQIRLPGTGAALGAAEASVAELEKRLAAAPFRAPEAHDLGELRLGARELAAAERAGRVLRLRDGVVLLPTAPALAMRALARLDQPFTTSEARQTLDTTRRVAIPLLEYLDGRGWTRRLDGGHREVVRG